LRPAGNGGPFSFCGPLASGNFPAIAQTATRRLGPHETLRATLSLAQGRSFARNEPSSAGFPFLLRSVSSVADRLAVASAAYARRRVAHR
jgi:hypothetical protein